MTEISQVVTPVRRRPNPPHRGTPGQKTGPPARSLSNPRHGPVQSVSNCPARPVTASDLGPCVPAKTTGTRALVGHKAPYPG